RWGLTPARTLVESDAERGLRDDLAREHRVGGMHAAESCVAEQAFQSRFAEDAEAARDVERQVDHLPPFFDGVMFRRHDLRRPETSMILAGRPIFGHAIEMRLDALQR